MNPLTNTVLAAAPVIEALQGLGVDVWIGGSLASSVHGMARSTVDADLVATLTESVVPLLVKRLDSTYYLSESAAIDAVRCRGCFNLIHLESMIKVDIFVPENGGHDARSAERLYEVVFPTDPPLGPYAVTAPEDIVLKKLCWYRAGQELSERQWGDVIGVLRVSSDDIDHAYLESWAVRLEPVMHLLVIPSGRAGFEAKEADRGGLGPAE